MAQLGAFFKTIPVAFKITTTPTKRGTLYIIKKQKQEMSCLTTFLMKMACQGFLFLEMQARSE